MDLNQIIQLAIACGTIVAAITAIIMAVITTKSFTKQLKLNFFADYTKRYQEIILNFPENINEKKFDFEKLTPETKAKTLRYMRAYFDLCSEEYFLWKNGHIDNKVWEEWKSGIEYAMSKTAFQKAWKDHINISTDYYQDFTDFINNILEKQNKFNALYHVEVLKNSISKGENSIKVKVVDKQNNPIDNAKIEVLITRPDSVKFDIKLTPISNSNGIYNFEPFQIEKLGRWQILSKVSIGDLTTFTKQEVYATN